MTLAELYKGMLLSQGFVTTPQRLRSVAPEALPQGRGSAAGRGAQRAADVAPTAELPAAERRGSRGKRASPRDERPVTCANGATLCTAPWGLVRIQ